MNRKACPRCNGEEWVFVAPHLTLMEEDAPHREHDMCAVFNGVLWIVRTGSSWRLMRTICQLGELSINSLNIGSQVAYSKQSIMICVRLAKGKKEQPTAAIFDGRTTQSTPENGGRPGYDGHNHK